jgi:hypothetical protein
VEEIHLEPHLEEALLQELQPVEVVRGAVAEAVEVEHGALEVPLTRAAAPPAIGLSQIC